MRTFETELPAEYVEAVRIHGFQSGFRNDLNTVMPGILLIATGCLWVKPTLCQIIASLALFAVSIYPYFALHELVHAVVYKAATHQKVTIAFTKGGAYCSLPDIFIYRPVAVAGTAAPLVVFSVLLTMWAVTAIMAGQWHFLAVGLLLSFHLFGCRSDVNLLRELGKYKESSILVRDNGAEQYIYRR